jgi:hypothetical protein
MIITVVIDALKHSERIQDYLKMSVVSLVVILAISSWFYIHLFISAGSPMAFNRAAADQLNFSNQSRSFYLGRGSGRLFNDPVRESFPRQFIPIFYSETWGDYWCFFSVFGWDSRESVYVAGDVLTSYVSKAPEWLTTNRSAMGAYLGRVNLVSILPTFLAILGFCSGFITFCYVLLQKRSSAENIGYSFFMLLILSSMLGYLWFHLKYPVPGEGDTIKATYMLQIFPFVHNIFLHGFHDLWFKLKIFSGNNLKSLYPIDIFIRDMQNLVSGFCHPEFEGTTGNPSLEDDCSH